MSSEPSNDIKDSEYIFAVETFSKIDNEILQNGRPIYGWKCYPV